MRWVLYFLAFVGATVLAGGFFVICAAWRQASADRRVSARLAELFHEPVPPVWVNDGRLHELDVRMWIDQIHEAPPEDIVWHAQKETGR